MRACVSPLLFLAAAPLLVVADAAAEAHEQLLTNSSMGTQLVASEAQTIAAEAPPSPPLITVTICYARNYPNLLLAYCHNDESACDFIGLQYHWETSGKNDGLTSQCVPLSPPPPGYHSEGASTLGESTLCYALNYPHLFKEYCGNDQLACDMNGLQWHWEHEGYSAGMSRQCWPLPPATPPPPAMPPHQPPVTICYARNYPNLFSVYCQNDESKCDFPGLQYHWESIGIRDGLHVHCSPPPTPPLPPHDPSWFETSGATPSEVCYATNYPDLFNAFCLNGIRTCDLKKLAEHWETVGIAANYTNICQPPSPPMIPPSPSPAEPAGPASEEFAEVLEQCIRNVAAEAASSFPTWANTCLPPTEKIDKQAALLTKALAPIRDRYGYSAALWCALYSVVRACPSPSTPTCRTLVGH